jgi:OOP family OmpA-OmpF porin
MKKIFSAFVLLWFCTTNTNGQILQGLGNRLKNKVSEKIISKAEQGVGTAMDKLGKKSTKSTTKDEADNATTGEHVSHNNIKPKEIIQSYSKYDFIPGEQIIFMDDFTNSSMGEMPAGWNSNGKGEVVNVEGYEGKFLRMFPAAKYLTGNTSSFGDSFSIEFDLIMTGTPPSGTRYFPELVLGMFSSERKRTTDNSFLSAKPQVANLTEIQLKPNLDAGSKAILTTKGAMGVRYFESGIIPIKEYSESFSKSAHYSIQVDKQRIRFWVNGKKYFDVQQAIKTTPVLNQFFINPLEYWCYNEENYGLYLSNLKIAKGIPKPDLQLIEGKGFTTNAIQFNVASDEIKPQSMGIIRVVGNTLKDNPNVKLQIIGHTDNNGSASENLSLSRKRAEAVRRILIDSFAIVESRLTIDGKGASLPLQDNQSAAGRAMNRRVEFVRIN